MKNNKDKIHYKKIEELFGFTRQTWVKWQKEDRPITRLINKYFTNYDVIEFLSTNQVSEIERTKVGKELLDILNDKCENILSQIMSIEQPKESLPKESLINFIIVWHELNKHNITKLKDEKKLKDNFFNSILYVSDLKDLKGLNTNPYSMYHILRILDQLEESEFKYFIFNYFNKWQAFTSDILTEIIKSHNDTI